MTSEDYEDILYDNRILRWSARILGTLEVIALLSLAYGQLIIENAKIYAVGDDLLDQIFEFMVRDMAKFALQLYSKTSSTKVQQLLCMAMVRKPAANPARMQRIWKEQVLSQKGAYEMNP